MLWLVARCASIWGSRGIQSRRRSIQGLSITITSIMSTTVMGWPYHYYQRFHFVSKTLPFGNNNFVFNVCISFDKCIYIYMFGLVFGLALVCLFNCCVCLFASFCSLIIIIVIINIKCNNNNYKNVFHLGFFLYKRCRKYIKYR